MLLTTILLALIMLTDGESKPIPPEPPTPQPSQTSSVVEALVGKASWYGGSRSFHGQPHVAMQDGQWTGKVQRYVEVTINGHSEILPVVDWCGCHRDTKKEKVIDLSIETVNLFGLNPSSGVWDVEVREIP